MPRPTVQTRASKGNASKRVFRRKVFARVVPLLACALVAILNGTGSAKAEVYSVATRNIEPFSFIRDGNRVGYSIDLWKAIADDLQLDYSTIEVGTAKQMVTAVQAGKADIGVGALSITSEREKQVDFTQPFFESGLQVLVRKSKPDAASALHAIVVNLATPQLAGGLVIALLVMFGISHLVWKYEHPINEEMWPRSYWQGIGESLWWTISIFLVGGADNKGPVGKGGRIVATIWMFASVIAVSLLTASLSAVLTVNSMPGDINGPDDLYGKATGTIEGSVAETWLKKQVSTGGQSIVVKSYPGVQPSLQALRSGMVNAIVYDAPILEYYIHSSSAEDLALVGELFERSNYGFAVKTGSPLRERINQAMLRLNEKGFSNALHAKWFGD
jgi:polar amino acid transport system substrate-binding protein